MKEKLAIRLLKEKLELHGNMVSLDKFLADPENTREIDPREVELLHNQLEAMQRYYGILNVRSYYHANDNTWPDHFDKTGKTWPNA